MKNLGVLIKGKLLMKRPVIVSMPIGGAKRKGPDTCRGLLKNSTNALPLLILLPYAMHQAVDKGGENEYHDARAQQQPKAQRESIAR